MRAVILVIAMVAAACGEDLDPPWQLDHDRIVAIRATPPSIVSGDRAAIDALIATKGSTVSEQVPEAVLVVSPTSLAGAVAFEDGEWIVTAPDAAALDGARAELGLDPGEPVPLQLGVSYAGQTLFGLKSVRLGVSGENPPQPAPMIDGAAAPGIETEIVIGKLIDVPLAIDAPETDEINWLTSCGTMHDFDLPNAHINVEEDDPTEGQLVVVHRDEVGGVVWQVWSIRAE